MPLLPSLRFGADRWWLPRSPDASETIVRVLLHSGRQTSPDRNLIGHVVASLQRDPALFIYASLSYPGLEASLDGLATWFARQAISRFASGDAFLGTPELTTSIEARWAELTAYYKTLSVSRWLDEAPLWLEVTGPSVPSRWRRRWPEIDIDSKSSGVLHRTDTADSLQQLARYVQRTTAIEQSFDKRLHKSKLAALKQLAYGLSHEINNPLTNISTRAQQLQQQEPDAARHAVLGRMIQQVYRAHQMIADLMFYANPPQPQPSRFDVCQLVSLVTAEFIELAKQQSIRIKTETPTDSLDTIADREMISEAIRVLIRNSMEAIGAEGTIVASVISENDQLRIHVADSGPGLSVSSRQHAFDPYYSGREAGRGLGLGLCRAYRIAKLHHGEVSLAGGPAGCVATITLQRAG